jgi:hypothetical protein
MTVHGFNSIRTFGELSYGDVESRLGTEAGIYKFPPTYTLSFNSKPVLSDNGVNFKYTKSELTVVWYLPYQYIFTRQNPANMPDGISPSPITIDTAVQQIRAVLMQPRKELRCTYQGLGPTNNATNYGFVINDATDVNFGPIPTDFKWKNLAAQQAVELTWVVTFCTHNQIIFNNANTILVNPENIGLTELSWSRSYDIDEIGSVTVTTSGKYSVSSCAKGQNVSTNVISRLNPDRVRYLVAFPVPLYCRRVSQRFQHDPNSLSCTFTLVDKQFPTENAMPPKAMKMDMSHEVSSSLFGGRLEGKGFHQWNNVIQGNITLPPGEAFSTAFFLFWFYARQRLFRTEPGGIAYDKVGRLKKEKLDDASNPEEGSEYARNIITKVSYKENLFDRTHSFRLEYVGVYDRDKLIQQSGLFTPLYNYKENQSGNYKYWYVDIANPDDREPWHAGFTRPTSSTNPLTTDASLFSQWSEYKDLFAGNPNYFNSDMLCAWDVYGYTGISEDDGPYLYYPDDQLIQNVKINKAVHGINLPAWVYPPNEDTTQPSTQQKYSADLAKRSYIMHENSFQILEDVNTFQVVRQRYDVNIDRAMKSALGVNIVGKENRTVALHNMQAVSEGLHPSDQDYTTSYNSQPVTTIVMSGYAIRVGFPPTIPCAFQYKTHPLVRSGQSIVTLKQLGKGIVPVYLATWSIPYYVNTSVHTNFFKDLTSSGFSGVLT